MSSRRPCDESTRIDHFSRTLWAGLAEAVATPVEAAPKKAIETDDPLQELPYHEVLKISREVGVRLDGVAPLIPSGILIGVNADREQRLLRRAAQAANSNPPATRRRRQRNEEAVEDDDEPPARRQQLNQNQGSGVVPLGQVPQPQMQQVVAQAVGVVAAAAGQPQVLDNADVDAAIGIQNREEMERVIELLRPVLGAPGEQEADRVHRFLQTNAPNLMDLTPQVIQTVSHRKTQLMHVIADIFNPRVGFGRDALSLQTSDCSYLAVKAIESPMHMLVRTYVDDEPKFRRLMASHANLDLLDALIGQGQRIRQYENAEREAVRRYHNYAPSRASHCTNPDRFLMMISMELANGVFPSIRSECLNVLREKASDANLHRNDRGVRPVRDVPPAFELAGGRQLRRATNRMITNDGALQATEESPAIIDVATRNAVANLLEMHIWFLKKADPSNQSLNALMKTTGQGAIPLSEAVPSLIRDDRMPSMTDNANEPSQKLTRTTIEQLMNLMSSSVTNPLDRSDPSDRIRTFNAFQAPPFDGTAETQRPYINYLIMWVRHVVLAARSTADGYSWFGASGVSLMVAEKIMRRRMAEVINQDAGIQFYQANSVTAQAMQELIPGMEQAAADGVMNNDVAGIQNAVLAQNNADGHHVVVIDVDEEADPAGEQRRDPAVAQGGPAGAEAVPAVVQGVPALAGADPEGNFIQGPCRVADDSMYNNNVQPPPGRGMRLDDSGWWWCDNSRMPPVRPGETWVCEPDPNNHYQSRWCTYKHSGWGVAIMQSTWGLSKAAVKKVWELLQHARVQLAVGATIAFELVAAGTRGAIAAGGLAGWTLRFWIPGGIGSPTAFLVDTIIGIGSDLFYSALRYTINPLRHILLISARLLGQVGTVGAVLVHQTFPSSIRLAGVAIWSLAYGAGGLYVLYLVGQWFVGWRVRPRGVAWLRRRLLEPGEAYPAPAVGDNNV